MIRTFRRRSGIGPIALVLLAALFAAPAAFAQLAPAPQAQRLSVEEDVERLRLQLDQIGRSLARANLSDADLAANRQAIVPIVQRIGELIAEQTPKVEAVAAQLDKLGPKPDARAPPESAEAARQRADLEKALEAAGGVLRVARSEQVRAEQLIAAIAERRRAIFNRTLFERSTPLVSPWLWTAVARAAPQEFRALRTTLGDWSDEIARQFRDGAWPALLTAALLAVGIFGPFRTLASRFDPRSRDAAAEPDAGRKATIAALVLGIGGAALLLLASLVYVLLQGAGVLPQRVAPIVGAAVYGAAKFAAFNLLADVYFAPRRPVWRLASVNDERAARVARAVLVCILVLVVGEFANTLALAIAASEPVLTATRGVFAALFALTLLGALRGLQEQDQCEEETLGPAVPVAGGAFAAVRAFLVVAGGAILLAVVTGFVRLGGFLAEQSAWLFGVGVALAVLMRLADDGMTRLMVGDGPLGRALTVGVGFRRRPVEQAAVLVSGLARLALIFAAVLLALAPWGIESGDILGSVRAALFGFKIGDVTISLWAIAVALGVFVLGVVGTRGVQRWLDDRFLPRTDLDSGLRNSIRTAVGYFGFIVAVAISVSSLGFSLDRVAIIAGALSVGIGLGLQSVVNNFVSGLILLWERSIKVGDLIVVGDEQGYVRRIHVRSTEVQTFDRTTVIVPNSSLVSGIVKNKVHAGRSGRLTLALAVPRDADPRAVAEAMEAVTRAHRDVLDEPRPRAMFKRINENTLDFEINAFVADVETCGGVASDLHFSLHSELARLGLAQPLDRPADPAPGAPRRAAAE